MTLGEKIQFYRKKNKYSQEKIAELIGISRQAVTKWESNQSAPSTENLLKLADLFEISLDELTKINTINVNNDKKQNNRKWAKKIAILWGISLVILITVFIFTLIPLIGQLFNLMILLGITIVVIYIVTLLIKALNKYIHSL